MALIGEASEREVHRRKAGGVAAVAGAIGAQRLAIGEGYFWRSA